MSDPLASPRTRVDALRDMFTIAIRDASEEELLAVQQKIGAWALERTLDAALGRKAEEAPKPTPKTTPKSLNSNSKFGPRCRDAERVQLALLALRERFERDGIQWTPTSVAKMLGWSSRSSVRPSFIDCTASRLAMARLQQIEEYIRGE